MSTVRSKVGTSYLWLIAAGLTIYCVVLTAITGDIGFDGDDWWVIACPYWNGFPDALAQYTQKFLRPLEGFYLVCLFKLVGFNKPAFHLCSLLLLVGAAVLMGAALDKAFPGRRNFVSVAVLSAFFLPPVSCLTYVMFTDNSRLCMLFFWTSTIAFQRWAERSSSWPGLLVPIVLYLFSFLTYEASSFLIFAVPLLVWPVHRRQSDRSSDRAFMIKLGSAVLVAFGAAVAVRYVFFQGGAVRTGELLPPFEFFWSYLALLPLYLLAPFTSMSADRWALAAGLLAASVAVGMFLLLRRESPVETAAKGRFEPKSQWYPVVLGGAILLLGMLPYQLAGYGGFVEMLKVKYGLLPDGDTSWFNFTWASRIFSSASFGAAILLACCLSAPLRSRADSIGKAAVVVIIGFMAVFHAGLSQDWREAAEIRNHLMRGLVTQVPDAKPGTNFVFLDIACSHKRAEIIRRENGLRELVQMLYGDQTLGAWRIYPDAYDRITQVYQQAVATPEGLLTRSQRQGEPAGAETTLLFGRSGHDLVLLDRIAVHDGLVRTGIEWKGVEKLTSNFERIEARRTITPEERLARKAWTSGLISTLHLTFLKSPTRSTQRPTKRLVR